jgi:hypothetical protein
MGNWVRGNVKFISKNEENIERLVNSITHINNDDKDVMIGGLNNKGLSIHSPQILTLNGYYGIMFWVEFYRFSSDKVLSEISDKFDVVSYLSLSTEGGFDDQCEIYYKDIKQYTALKPNCFYYYGATKEADDLFSSLYNNLDPFANDKTEEVIDRFLSGNYITSSECPIITKNNVQKRNVGDPIYLLNEDDINKDISNNIIKELTNFVLDNIENIDSAESLYDIINDLKYCI